MASSSSSSQCKASCVLFSSGSGSQPLSASVAVLGSLHFTQAPSSSSSTQQQQPLRIQGTLHHLSPGTHGLSVCTAGDLSLGVSSCGTIFNPFGKTHGSPKDEHQRMVGDLGNIVADDQGVAVVDLTDTTVTLWGPHSVVGRSLVISSGADDMGRGGHEQSLVTGNSGPRVAAGVIGLAL